MEFASHVVETTKRMALAQGMTTIPGELWSTTTLPANGTRGSWSVTTFPARNARLSMRDRWIGNGAVSFVRESRNSARIAAGQRMKFPYIRRWHPSGRGCFVATTPFTGVPSRSSLSSRIEHRNSFYTSGNAINRSSSINR